MLSSSGISNSYLASHVINQIKIHSERARKLELRVLMDARRYIMLILPVLSSPAAHQSAPAQKAGTHGNHNYQLLLNAPDATAGWWYNSLTTVGLYVRAKVKHRSVYTSWSTNHLRTGPILWSQPNWLDIALGRKCQELKSHPYKEI